MQLVLKHKIVILLISGFTAIFLGAQFTTLSVFDHESIVVESKAESKADAPQGATYDDEDEENIIPPEHFVQHPDGSWHAFEHDRVDGNANHTLDYAMKYNLPILIWWTPFTADANVVKKCNLGSCFFTHDRKLLDVPQTQGFFFYGTDLNIDDLPLPRKESHEWALLHEESPKNKAILSQADMLTLFNHTSTFRQESDYPITTQYLRSIRKLLKKPRHSLADKTKLDIAPVIYLQSGCNPPSDRDAYVNELMKHIRVDSFGKCLKNKDLPASLKDPLTMFKRELLDYVSQYKFAIAFENGICKDYVTEKLWRTLEVGVVPIYKGAPNIHEWLPSNTSAIMAEDFAGPVELAKYIKSIENDPEKYESYLEYKTAGISNEHLATHMSERQWGVNDFSRGSPITGFECMVCDRIHENRRLEEAGRKRKRHVATKEHYGCPKPVKYEQFQDPSGTEFWERNTWSWEFDNSIKQASELKKKVLGI